MDERSLGNQGSLAASALSRRRTWLAVVAGAVAVVALAGIVVAVVRERPHAWLTALIDDNRCEEILSEFSILPAQPASGLDLDETIPQTFSPPPGFALRTDGPLDLEGAVALHREAPGEWRDALRRYGFARGWVRSWGGQTETLSVRAYETEPPAAVRTLHEWAGELSCPQARDGFEVAGVPGSAGQRTLYRDGLLADQVSFVRGSRRYVVTMASYDHDEVDRDVVAELARAVDALARG